MPQDNRETPPAAAPLGTDDEAAGTPITGTPITPGQMDMARAGEIRTDPPLQEPPGAGPGRSRLWVYAVVAVGVLVLVLLAFGR